MKLDTDLHLRLPTTLKKVLEDQAEAAGLPFASFVRLILVQASRTPFRLHKGRTA